MFALCASVVALRSCVRQPYDSVNRLTAIRNSWGDSFTFGFDGVGRLKSLSRPGGRTDYTYAGYVLASMIHSSSGVTKSFVEYTYDDRNYPVSKRSPAGQVAYSYDGNGQLTMASGVGTSESFVYDSLGNRTQDQSGAYTYDSASQRLMEDWQYRYSYDANGNLIQKIPKDSSKNAFVYSYSSKNQLVQIQVLENPLGQVVKQVNYQYDVLGRRMQKVVWDRENQADPKKTFTRRYIYDGDNILAEFDGNNSLLARYTHSPLRADDILSADLSAAAVAAGIGKYSGKFYYLKDVLGTVTDVVDSAGSVIQRYDYEAFGKIRSVSDESGTDITSSPVLKTSFAFTGREWDEDAGLYYYRARYYDPSIGRFIQKDAHPGKLENPNSVVNSYTYVSNMPTIATDPSGKFIFMALLAFTSTWAAGATAMGAAAMVGAALLGSFVAAGIHSAATGDWSNFGLNAEKIFNVSAAWLTLSSAGAYLFGGGVKAAGANSIFQGFVQSKNPFFLPEGYVGDLTIGPAALFNGTGSLAAHSLGHTIQFFVISALAPNVDTSYGIYLSLGAIGAIPKVGAFWENWADRIGGAK